MSAPDPLPAAASDTVKHSIHVVRGLAQVVAALAGFVASGSAWIFGRYYGGPPTQALGVALAVTSVALLIGAGRSHGLRGQLAREGSLVLVVLLAVFGFAFPGGWFLVTALVGLTFGLLALSMTAAGAASARAPQELTGDEG